MNRNESVIVSPGSPKKCCHNLGHFSCESSQMAELNPSSGSSYTYGGVITGVQSILPWLGVDTLSLGERQYTGYILNQKGKFECP